MSITIEFQIGIDCMVPMELTHVLKEMQLLSAFILGLWTLAQARADDPTTDDTSATTTYIQDNDTATDDTTTYITTDLVNDVYTATDDVGGALTSEEPASAAGDRDKGGSSNIVGAVVGGVGVAVALIVVTVLALIMVLKRYRSMASWKQEEAPADYYSYNALYGQCGLFGTTQLHLRNSEFSTSEIRPHTYNYVGEDSGEQIALGQSHQYGDHIEWSNGSLPFRSFIQKQEGIYEKPAKDESMLYAQLKESFTVTRDTVVLGDYLGSGQFGTVYKGMWQSATQGEVEVAVKTLKKRSKKKDRVKFLQEAVIMRQFKHPNVVEMYGVVTIGEPVLLILEMLKCGNLLDYLNMRSNGGGVNVDGFTLLKFCRQVASGMVYLSSMAFIHRDLAARNILVSEDNSCKIADFGMSRDLMDEKYYVSHGGKIPVKWTAPEALYYKKYSTASDVWSYGVLIYEIWSVGQRPYNNFTNIKVLKLVNTGYRLPPPPGCPRALYAIMMSCWHPVKSKRPCFPDISHQLSLPDAELLKWAEEDKSTHPEVDKLGADLLYAQDLYKDLQVLYKRKSTVSKNPWSTI